MMSANLPSNTNGDYVAGVQRELLTKLDTRGGSMSGTLDMSGYPIINTSVFSGQGYRVSCNAIVTSSSTSSTNLNVAVFDSSSGRIIKDSGVQISSISGALPLSGGTMTGSINLNTNGLTNVGIISGPTYSRSGDNIVSNAGSSASGRIATFSGTTGKVIQDGGARISDLLLLTGGNMTGPIDSVSTLDLGINFATAINIGNSNAVTQINGSLVSPLPKASWYSLAGVSPKFNKNEFREIPLVIDNYPEPVDFRIDEATGILTYRGSIKRTFVYTCNLNISFTESSTLELTVNINRVTGFVNDMSGYSWDVSILENRRMPFHMSDQITLSPDDSVILVASWGNTTDTEVTFGRCSFQIFALVN